MLHKWGEEQHHPQTQWADLFFDLVFVGACFNLGVLLKYNVSAEGCTAFLLMYLTLSGTWKDCTEYSGRIGAGQDAAHSLLQLLQILSVALAAIHVRSFEQLFRARDSYLAFGLSLAMAAFSATKLLLYGEYSWCVLVNRKWGKAMARRAARDSAVFWLAALAAYPWTAVQERVPSGVRSAALLCLWFAPFAASFQSTAAFIWAIPQTPRSAANLDHPPDHGYGAVFPSRRPPPLHVGYMTHRYGEWVMLHLGEGVLSLLVVPFTPAPTFYATFACGFVTMFGLQVGERRHATPRSNAPLSIGRSKRDNHVARVALNHEPRHVLPLLLTAW
jgi:hypothetical protein